MDRRLMHYILPVEQIQLDGTIAKLPQKIAAVVEEATDNAIVEAILAAARAEGVTDLYLLDKTFIMDAIREKQERENPKPLTIEDLMQMHGEPVFVTVPGKPHRSKWCIVDIISPRPALIGKDYACDLLLVGTTAIEVYRHKPKEEHHDRKSDLRVAPPRMFYDQTPLSKPLTPQELYNAQGFPPDKEE